MMRRGWVAAEAGSVPAVGTFVAQAREAWPQDLELDHCKPVWHGEVQPPWPFLPRGYSGAGRANLHACWVMGVPPVRTIVPWRFSGDPYEQVDLCVVR